MQLPITFFDSTSTKETLICLKDIRVGKLQVFHVYCPQREKYFALKLFPKTAYGVRQYQKEKLMLEFRHPHIIKHIPSMFHHDQFYGILTDYARYGDFFNVTKRGLLDTEDIIRTYFHQLVEGVEYIHEQGVAHLDLKLENIMLGDNFDLRIIDFDQAQKSSEQQMDSGGSVFYRAPEVWEEKCWNLKAADVFSIGVILFAFVAKEFPFMEVADPELENIKSYNMFDKDNQKFWQGKFAREKIDKKLLTEDFIELINGMLIRDVQKRITIKDIKASKWYNKKPILDQKVLKEEMRSRFEAVLRRSEKKTSSSSTGITAKIQKATEKEEQKVK